MITINENKSILDNIVRGYRNIEPAILAALALERHIFLEAKHGVGKTTLGKVLGRATDQSGRGFRYYACDKASIVDLGGMPDMENKGDFGFYPNNRSLFGASIVVADEMPRANKDRMNYWMEVLEEGTFMGLPLENLKMVIATGNPSTYSGNNQMDPALRSRFLFWLPCNNFDTASSEEIEAMIDLNLKPRDLAKVGSSVKDLLAEMRVKIEEYQVDDVLISQLKSFISMYFQFVKDKISQESSLREDPEAYICPRTFANQMIWGMFGLAAYFEVCGYKNVFQHAGENAVKYILETRHAAAGEKFLGICNAAWRQLRKMLIDGVDTPQGRIQWKFASAISPTQKIGFWRQNIAEAVELLEPIDWANMARETLEQVQREDLGQVGAFWQVMKSDDQTKHIATEVEGLVLTELHRKMTMVNTEGVDARIKEVATRYAQANYLTPTAVAEILGS